MTMDENIIKQDEEVSIKQEKDKIIKFLFNKKIIIVVALLVLLVLAYQIRTANLPILIDVTTGTTCLGPDLDPFLFLRYSKIIIEEGALPEIDYMRYYPIGYETAKETKLLPYLLAYNYKIMNIFGDYSITYAAVMFPVFMFLLTCIVCFLFVRKLFENKGSLRNYVALIATAFLIVAPSLLTRTIAGIPEKESAGFFFMFLSLYFFVSCWKKDTIKKSLIFASLAGLSTALMGLVWGGWAYLFVSISAFVFIGFILGKISKRRFYCYSIWFFVSIVIPLLAGERYSLFKLLDSTTTGLGFIIFGLLLVDFILFKTKIRNLKVMVVLQQKKVPKKVISIGVFVILALVGALIVLGPSFVSGFSEDIYTKLTEPITTRHASTVAENKQPYFTNWRDNFGPVVKGIPLFFWMFFIGSICLFYEVVKKLDLKKKSILICSYIIFLIALIFSRYSPSNQFNGVNNISIFVLFGGFLLIILSFCYVLYKSYKEDKLDILQKINSNYLFLIVLFIITLIGARGAVRLIMVLVVPAVALIGYFIIFVYEQARYRDKITSFVCISIIIVLALFVFYSNYQTTYDTAEQFGPSAYTQQWQKAMQWVREETPKDAVFNFWWDYGYWVQSIGERATVLDGSNSMGVWNYYTGRHVLTGQSELEALEFLYAHNVTHFLIDSTDVGKYGAYSMIGSDENYDRYSWIGAFVLNKQATQETSNSIQYMYQGGVALDEDYLYKDETGNELLLPAQSAGIGVLGLIMNNNGSYEQPIAIFVYQNKQTNIPLRYLYINNELYDFENGYEGTLYVIPGITETGINPINNAFFLSERNMRANWVKWYLLNQTENLELVHSEPSYIVQDIKNQVPDFDSDFIYYGGFYGPIKIWKVSYSEDIEFKPEYLEINYPDEVRKL